MDVVDSDGDAVSYQQRLSTSSDQLTPTRERYSMSLCSSSGTLRWQHTYKNTHRRRGYFLIINNWKFDATSGKNDRRGTQEDVAKLTEVFGNILGFDVIRHENLSAIDMTVICMNVADLDHSESDCFGCAVLSHGDEDHVFGSDGKKMEIKLLLHPFNGSMCRTLRAKPKFFFFQSGRGELFDYGADTTDDEQSDSGDVSDAIDIPATSRSVDIPALSRSLRAPSIPDISDFCCFYAAPSGYHALRNTVDGSWFIDALHTVFGRFAYSGFSFNWLMTRVNHYVAYQYQSRSRALDGCKQIPSFESTLTKDFYFTPKT